MNETNAHQSKTKRPADEPAMRTKQVYGADEGSRGRNASGRACGCGVGMGRKIPGGALAERCSRRRQTHFPAPRARKMIKSKTSEHGGAAEPTRPVGGVRTGKACATPPGRGLRGARPVSRVWKELERCTIFQGFSTQSACLNLLFATKLQKVGLDWLEILKCNGPCPNF